MILTGKQILDDINSGTIVFTPFDKAAINPNSINYRLGSQIVIPGLDGANSHQTIPEEGFVLEPRRTYLGHTLETIGSAYYSMSLIGRSSIGRLGLFLQVSANLGHVGSCHRWTLELVAAKPIKIYPRMKIGQVSFWDNLGVAEPYLNGYSEFNEPRTSRLVMNQP